MIFVARELPFNALSEMIMAMLYIPCGLVWLKDVQRRTRSEGGDGDIHEDHKASYVAGTQPVSGRRETWIVVNCKLIGIRREGGCREVSTEVRARAPDALLPTWASRAIRETQHTPPPPTSSLSHPLAQTMYRSLPSRVLSRQSPPLQRRFQSSYQPPDSNAKPVNMHVKLTARKHVTGPSLTHNSASSTSIAAVPCSKHSSSPSAPIRSSTGDGPSWRAWRSNRRRRVRYRARERRYDVALELMLRRRDEDA